MKKMIRFFSVVLMFVVVTTACNKVPQVELDAANAAVTEAKAAGADIYLPEQFKALSDSMSAVTEAIEVQKSKLFGKYADIKVKLASYTEQAAALQAETAVKKEEIKAEVTAAIETINGLVASNKELLAKAPKGKEGKAAIEAIEGELTVIEGSVAEISSLLEADNLLGAQSKAKAAIEKGNQINAELTEVIEKYSKKRK
jgi:hypothetical protein